MMPLHRAEVAPVALTTQPVRDIRKHRLSQRVSEGVREMARGKWSARKSCGGRLPTKAEQAGKASRVGIENRIKKARPPVFGMLGMDPPVPDNVDDPEEVTKQEDLVENIYTTEVLDEYERRCDEVDFEEEWDSGMIPEDFLSKIVGKDQAHTDALRDAVLDQIAHWLSLPPNEKRRWLDHIVETVVLDDMGHPPFRRFKELYEPLGLRTEERAVLYLKDLPEWRLVGEYTGVWDESENFSQRIEKDPMGLGVMKRDKVAAPSYTSDEASEEIQKALRTSWDMSLELDASKAHNRLALINDCANVPGYNNQPNAVLLGCEDSRTLQPHVFQFTACNVKAGQEALLDYGSAFHENMEDELRQAAEHPVLPSCLQRSRDMERLQKDKEKLQGAITELQRTIEALEKERPHPEAAGEGKRKAQQVEGAAKKVPKIEVPKGISVSSGAGTGQLVLQSECGDFDIHFK
ncbi:g5610 [Coccomyxa viridis]|uniref:G5610 protein n=1 Tax=Coccomyxa viridis TaxID=1274662 RepID=A0ABP1FTA3_9CHLO